MRAIRAAFITVTLSALSLPAAAEGGPFEFGLKPFVGPGMAIVSAPRQRIGTEDNSATFHPFAGLIRGGLVLNDWFDVEAHYGLNVEGDKINEAADINGAENPKYQIDSMWGVKLRGKVYTGEGIAVYAQVGYGSIDFEVTGLENANPPAGIVLPQAITTEDISYGAGIRFDISPVSSLNLDWEATDSDQGEIHTIGLYVNLYLIELFTASDEDEDDYY